MPQRLELICQPAGTGKTHYCIEAFREAIFKEKDPFEQSCFFILPNQEHADRIHDLLLRRIPPGQKTSAGLLNPSILTINEFIKRFARVATERTPGDIFRRTLVQSALQDLKPVYFNETLVNDGFLDLLCDFISEVREGFLTAEEFEKRAVPFLKENSPFGKKLKDLGALLELYDQELIHCGLQDPGDLIRTFVESVNQKMAARTLRLVILDGFFHFTKAQLEFIQAIARLSGRVVVTLTIGGDAERGHVFEYPQNTRQALVEMGFKEKVLEKASRNCRTTDPALQFLEKSLFHPEPSIFKESREAVCIFEATGVSGEIEMIAREIQRLYREEAYHYSDIGLLLRSLSPYEETIRSVFSRLGVPVAVHERRKLKQNSFIQALLKWTKLLGNGWQREDLLRLLQSEYYGFPPEIASEIERFSLGEGILEGEEAWQKFCDKLSPSARKDLEDLLTWSRRLLSTGSPDDFKRQLLGFVRGRNMLRRCLTDAADVSQMKEDFLAYRTLQKILDERVLHQKIQAKTAVTFENERSQLIQAIEISLFSVPVPDKNCVQVYDIAFALQKEYKVIFIAGLLEKTFPKNVAEDPLLKDDERRALNGGKPCFEERKRRISGERYFFYMALTRAREKVYLTYPRYDLEGKEALPSFYVEEVTKCLGEVRIKRKEMGDIVPSFEEIVKRDDLFKILTDKLFEKKSERNSEPLKFYASVLNHCLEDPLYCDILHQVLRDEEEGRIKDPIILQWFKNQKGPYSATRLQLFALCPFKFFSGKILHLNEEKEDKNAAQMGSILHRVLKDIYQEALTERKEKTKELALRKLDEILELKEFAFHGLKRYQAELLREEMAEILLGFLEYDRSSQTQRSAAPFFFEKAFGRGDKNEEVLDFLRLSSENGEEICLEGRIDRIDYDPATDSAVVIDYKTGKSKTVDFMERLEMGIELQMPVYLLAVSKLLGFKTAGGEIYPLRDPKAKKGIYHRELMEALGTCSARSALDGEAFQDLLEKVSNKILEYVARIRKGEIAVRSKSCDHCAYNHVCRFEKWKLVYSEKGKIWERPQH